MSLLQTFFTSWLSGYDKALIISYLVVFVALAVYGFHRSQLVYLYYRYRSNRPEPLGRLQTLPKVTVQLPLFKQERGADRDLDVLAPEPCRKPWAWLLRHVFEIDVTTCRRCGGPTRWLEAATTPAAIARLLAKHGLGPRPPPRRSAPRGQLRLALPGA
jgi:hypothetical protein